MIPLKHITKGQMCLLRDSIEIDEQLIKNHGITLDMLSTVLVMKRNMLKELTNSTPEFTEIKN